MKRLLTTAAFISFVVCSYAQVARVRGTWITPEQECLAIVDTGKSAENYISNTDLRDEQLGLELINDTLSFQRHYTSSRTQFKVQHLDRYDLKLIRLTDTVMVVEPASSFSKGFFNGRDRLTFTRQELTRDTTLQIEKIIFHTTRCYGTCGIYHIEIDKTGSFKLHSEFVHSDSSWKGDITRQGYYRGKMPNSIHDSLIKAIQTSNLRALRMAKHECCDGSLLTIIIYFNGGQRRYFKTMFYPVIARNMVNILYNFTRNAINYGTKTDEKFELEKE
jgi:hypothetical protein